MHRVRFMKTWFDEFGVEKIEVLHNKLRSGHRALTLILLNIFRMNQYANCKIGVLIQQQDLTSHMLLCLNRHIFLQKHSKIKWKAFSKECIASKGRPALY